MRTQHFVVFDSTRSQPDCARSFVTLTRQVLKNGILEKWEIVQSGSGATFREADFTGLGPEGYFRVADHTPKTSFFDSEGQSFLNRDALLEYLDKIERRISSAGKRLQNFEKADAHPGRHRMT